MYLYLIILIAFIGVGYYIYHSYQSGEPIIRIDTKDKHGIRTKTYRHKRHPLHRHHFGTFAPMTYKK